MPTGGVSPDPDNLKSWFDAGVTCVGMGSKLITKSVLKRGDFDQLTADVRATLDTIQEVKPKQT